MLKGRCAELGVLAEGCGLGGPRAGGAVELAELLGVICPSNLVALWRNRGSYAEDMTKGR